MKLYCGDCLEVMEKIPDKSVDLILTDPPYGTTACKWDSVIPFTPMWEQINRIIKERGAVALFGSEPFSSALRMSNIKNYKYDWIWNKDKPSNFATANKQPMKYHEIISIFNSKTYYKQITTGHKKMNGQATYGRTSNLSVPDIKIKERYSGGKTTRNPSSIIKFNTCKHNTKDKSGFHPTQKPVALLEYLIKTYTLEGETVLDFTMGSGSTGVACVNTGRHFIGIEKDKNYFEMAKKRIKEAQKVIKR